MNQPRDTLAAASVSTAACAAAPGSALLEVKDLVREYTLPREHLFQPPGKVHALNGVTFSVASGRSLGVVGESGSGKSTLARLVMALDKPTAGTVHVLGRNLHELAPAPLREARRDFQMVFQDPYGSLDPRQTVERIVTEPLQAQGDTTRAEQKEQAGQVLAQVGLRPADLGKYPHEFSGGQRQRICIAMALACGPELLIADEPTTALDTEVQAQILTLLRELVAERNMALLLISHDLAVVAENADRMLVMYGGTIVEGGPTRAVFARMAHPYTRGLLAARPVLGHGADTRAALRAPLPTIPGSVPPLRALPPGCPFAGRCAFTIDACSAAPPPPVDMGQGHSVRCIRPEAMAEQQP